ncbi:MAG: LLM class flavin-dependent oxidoreductase, partial [Actinomycetota bacterium]
PEKPIPIMIGTWGPKMCALAGEVADEVKVGGSANPDVVPVIRGYIGAGEDRAGRPRGTVGVVMGAVTVVDSDREQARSAARRAVARYLPVVAPLDPTLNVDPELMKRLRRHVEHSEYEEASGLISDAMIDRFAFSGTAGDIIEAAEALFEAGASRVEFGAPHGLSSDEGIRVLGEQVVPVLRRA